MSARSRSKRQRIADITDRGGDAARARRSARMARAGVWVAVTPEDAETYAQDRLEDADIIERVYLKDRGTNA